MTDLFRYIEQSNITPKSKLDAIDVSDFTEFQNKIKNDLELRKSNPEIRKEVEDFIENNQVNDADSVRIGQQYLDLHEQLLGLTSPTADDVEHIVEKIFNSSSDKLVASDAFQKNKHLLNDLIIAVKMVTGFDKVRAGDLVTMRQSMAFIETFKKSGSSYLKDLKTILLKPILVPSLFLHRKDIKETKPFTPTTESTDDAQKREDLKKEYDGWKSAYNTLMSLRPDELQMVEIHKSEKTDAVMPKIEHKTAEFINDIALVFKPVMALTSDAIRKLDVSVVKSLEQEFKDFKTTNYQTLISTVQKKIRHGGALIQPCDRVKSTTKVYRLGINAFAIKSDPIVLKSPITTPLDFTNAITKPVGIGNLQVVRQELIGYEVNEVSHIENILQGEILRHSTIRRETNELTISTETQTTQFDERDLQSTVRNELASEAQKESGQQASSSNDQTTSSSYGKLVENSKSNYAKTVTDKAVSSLTQQVTTQRIQREKKSFTEKSFHEFDNKDGDKNITGIYQWVDKKYKTRIMNYGTRLLYDVVIPEPAAFLIESLKNAPQPEGLELIKPDLFDLCPSCLDAFNYACLAAKYGVTGSVAPPPEDFIKTVPYKDAVIVGPPQVEGNGKKIDGFFYKAFEIEIPDNYKAVEGYCQMVRSNIEDSNSGIEFFIGEFYNNDIPNIMGSHLLSFPMHNETGHLPCTFRSYGQIYQYSFAIGINCQRTDKALEVWQLKTHAAIMNGYNRQLSDYQDKLSKFQAIMRSQMANASNYAHNPSIEKAELKKAFIYLLLSEHFNVTYIPTPDPEIIPTDPIYMKKWGAMVSFFERAFEWENIMYTYYPYFWGRRARWGELVLIQDLSPQFEEFLKAGAARIVVPARPGFEAALAHYHETGEVWDGPEIPDINSELYVSIIQEIKARNFAPGDEILVEEWEVRLPTTLVILKKDAILSDVVPV